MSRYLSPPLLSSSLQHPDSSVDLRRPFAFKSHSYKEARPSASPQGSFLNPPPPLPPAPWPQTFSQTRPRPEKAESSLSSIHLVVPSSHLSCHSLEHKSEPAAPFPAPYHEANDKRYPSDLSSHFYSTTDLDLNRPKVPNRIRMAMVEQRLAPGLQHPDSFCSPVSAPAPLAPVYTVLDPYSTVSSAATKDVKNPCRFQSFQQQGTGLTVQQQPPFNLSSQCDSSLLTPISAAGSPQLHQIHGIEYPHPAPPSASGVQQLTPPGSSKMYHQPWTAPFAVNSSTSQNSSPMIAQRPMTQEILEHYLSDGRRTPIPPEPYMGSFGVSDNTEPPSMSNPTENHYYLGVAPVDHHNPLLMRENQSVAMGIEPRGMSSAPLINQQLAPHHLRQRSPSVEDQGFHGQLGGRHSVIGHPQGHIMPTTSRIKRKPGRPKNNNARKFTAPSQPNDHKNCLGQEVAPTLKPDCPDEERCIFDARWRHRQHKGQHMWEMIQDDFNKRFERRPGKESLQMKFKRGRSKYFAWLQKDLEILEESWKEEESQRYESILRRFYEKGGSRNMCLNASDIEVKLVSELGLEEAVYTDRFQMPNLRRRYRASKRRPSAREGEDADVPMSDEVASIGSHTTLRDEVIEQVFNRPGNDNKWEEESTVGNEAASRTSSIQDKALPLQTREQELDAQAIE